jgi:hypothetical protein
MRRLDAIVGAAEGKLILIGDSSPRTTTVGDAEVRHLVPPAQEVFRKHVERLSNGAHGDPAAYIRLVRDGVPLPRSPREVVTLARRAVSRSPEAAREDLLRQDQRKQRETASDILEVRSKGGSPGRRRLPQHRRAFRLAYATLPDQPISHVFEATGLLLSALDAQSGWTDLGRTALEHSVEGLLGEILTTGWRSNDRLAPLVRLDDALGRAILDVVWHEFDHTRPALVSWLTTLVGADEPAFRHAATRAATMLAILDFDEVSRLLIDPWSGSGKVRVRRAAAQVIVILSSANRVNLRIRHAVNNWVWGAGNLRRDTAAWAYASGLRQIDPRWSLADLRRIAHDPMQRNSPTVAEGVGQLAGPGLHRLVVPTLVDWIREDQPARLVTRHAARSLLRMASNADHRRGEAAPSLLLALADGEIAPSDLSVLWYPALLGVSTRQRAWPTLLDWLRHADANTDLRKSVAELLHEMAGVPALRRRLRRCLRHSGAPSWIVTITEEWDK